MGSEISEKHLDLIQGVIECMARNSFLLKGWSVTLVAALLALAEKGADFWLVAIALLPTLTFWGLDGYFLAQEQLFRKLYGDVIGSDSDQSVPPYSLETEACSFSVWVDAALSRTLLAFHGVVFTVVIIVLIFLCLPGP